MAARGHKDTREGADTAPIHLPTSFLCEPRLRPPFPPSASIRFLQRELHLTAKTPHSFLSPSLLPFSHLPPSSRAQLLIPPAIAFVH